MFADHCCACYVLGGFRCHTDHEIHYCERHAADARILPKTLFRELARARADVEFADRRRIRLKEDREILLRLSSL